MLELLVFFYSLSEVQMPADRRGPVAGANLAGGCVRVQLFVGPCEFPELLPRL